MLDLEQDQMDRLKQISNFLEQNIFISVPVSPDFYICENRKHLRNYARKVPVVSPHLEVQFCLRF